MSKLRIGKIIAKIHQTKKLIAADDEYRLILEFQLLALENLTLTENERCRTLTAWKTIAKGKRIK